MFLQETSRIVAVVGNISTSKEEHILTLTRKIFALEEGVEDQKSYEQQWNLVFLPNFPCRTKEEDKDLWLASNEEKILEPENEDYPNSLYLNLLCKRQTFQDLQSMTHEAFK